GLHRNPISACGEDSRCGQRYLKDAGAVYVCLIHCGVDQRARQAAAILVNEDMEKGSRARSIEIYALRVHFGDIPSLASGHDEIVSGKVVKSVEGRLEILRPSADDPRVV